MAKVTLGKVMPIFSVLAVLAMMIVLPLPMEAQGKSEDCSDCTEPRVDGGTGRLERFAREGVLIELGRSVLPESDALENPGKLDYSVRCQNGGELEYCVDGQKRVNAFRFRNRGSPRVIPYGTNKYDGPYREFNFSFKQRARQAIKLEIIEFSIPGGPVSHTEMNSALYFFPRKKIPSVQVVGDSLMVTLPTDEKVAFDLKTKEVVGGVLREEAPMDNNPDRHKRKFAQLSYQGEGVMIRVDQRGETPERDMVWGTPKHATIAHKGKICRVRANLLFNQGQSEDCYFRFPTDEEFARKILVEKCGWKDFRF